MEKSEAEKHLELIRTPLVAHFPVLDAKPLLAPLTWQDYGRPNLQKLLQELSAAGLVGELQDPDSATWRLLGDGTIVQSIQIGSLVGNCDGSENTKQKSNY